MKTYKTNEIKNIAIVGCSGSGKTTLTEAMLFEGGIIKRRGTVEAKNTVSDYFPVEQEYGYSVFSTVFQIEQAGKKLNLIDCPGADDFAGGMVSAMTVADLAMMVVNGQYGVEVGTQNCFRYIKKMKKPMMFVVNQVDHEKCEYDTVIEQLQAVYGSKVVPVQYPLNAGPGFNSIIDVLLMKKLTFTGEGQAPIVEDIPASELDKAKALHMELVEKAAENEEGLMDKFFETEELSTDEIRMGARMGLATDSVYPVLCCSASTDVAVSRLLEFLANVAPEITDMPQPVNADGETVPYDSEAPTSVFFYKTSVEPHIGEVNYFKVMSGTLKAGDDLQNADRGSKERIAQLFCSAGANRVAVEELKAGDLGCTVKLKDVKIGNTLNAKDSNNKFALVKYPASKYSRAIKPANESEIEKMMQVLNRMHEEDPTWRIVQSKELRQTVVYGQGEFHLRTLKWRLEHVEKINVKYEEPKIPYRETITKAARADYRHKKQSGGAGQFGEVHMVIEPYYEGMPEPTKYKVAGKEITVNIKGKEEYELEWGGKLQYYNSIVGGAIDARFMPAILKGINEKMTEGPLTGSYARDIRVVIYDGKMHPVDSNEISFKLAARNAFKEAFRNAGPKIMEPIYSVEVLVPSDRMGDVMSDLQNRRALIEGMSSDHGLDRLNARVPLAELYRYSTTLSSLTNGRASYTMKFASYEQVPADVQDKLLKAYTDTDED